MLIRLKPTRAPKRLATHVSINDSARPCLKRDSDTFAYRDLTNYMSMVDHQAVLAGTNGTQRLRTPCHTSQAIPVWHVVPHILKCRSCSSCLFPVTEDALFVHPVCVLHTQLMAADLYRPIADHSRRKSALHTRYYGSRMSHARRTHTAGHCLKAIEGAALCRQLRGWPTSLRGTELPPRHDGIIVQVRRILESSPAQTLIKIASRRSHGTTVRKGNQHYDGSFLGVGRYFLPWLACSKPSPSEPFTPTVEVWLPKSCNIEHGNLSQEPADCILPARYPPNISPHVFEPRFGTVASLGQIMVSMSALIHMPSLHQTNETFNV